jgi:hypothetical protein
MTLLLANESFIARQELNNLSVTNSPSCRLAMRGSLKPEQSALWLLGG